MTWDVGTEILDVAYADIATSIVVNCDSQPEATVSSGGASRTMVALAYDA